MELVAEPEYDPPEASPPGRDSETRDNPESGKEGLIFNLILGLEVVLLETAYETEVTAPKVWKDGRGGGWAVGTGGLERNLAHKMRCWVVGSM